MFSCKLVCFLVCSNASSADVAKRLVALWIECALAEDLLRLRTEKFNEKEDVRAQWARTISDENLMLQLCFKVVVLYLRCYSTQLNSQV